MLNDLERTALSRLELREARWRVARWVFLAVGGALIVAPLWFVRPLDWETMFSSKAGKGVDLFAVYLSAVQASFSFVEITGGMLIILLVVLRWRGNPLAVLVLALARDLAGSARNEGAGSP